MNKTLIALVLSASLGMSTAYADQVTVDALQTAGIELTDAQVAEIAAAQGDELIAVLGNLIALSSPEAKGKIFAAIASTSPELIGKIVSLTTKGITGGNLGTTPVPSNNNDASPSA